MRLALAVACATSACGFSAPVGGTGDATPAGLCPWPLATETLDPCASAPADLATLADLAIVGDETYDTDSGLLTGTGGATSMPTSTVVDGMRVIWTKQFELRTGATLRGTGTLPLVIVATQKLSIAGTLAVNSRYTGNGTFANGAGANPSVCPTGRPEPGKTCLVHGGSGGGGGGFGTAGGQGGEGGDTHDCEVGVDGYPGGLGGEALVPRPTTLRGGCGGADGAPNDVIGAAVERGLGAPGGGAVALIAHDQLVVSGVIHAGGAGASPALDNRSGGGGGGSGGMIVLEAKALDVLADAVVAANGGAGSGGCEDNAAQPGEDGRADNTSAAGGAPQKAGSRGGDGGSLFQPEGMAGEIASRGGGGGGGGVGFIRIHRTTGSTIGKVSPAAQ